MRQNSIDYPGERAARRADIVEQPGYAGKHYFVVSYEGRQLTVHAEDETAAAAPARRQRRSSANTSACRSRRKRRSRSPPRRLLRPGTS